MNTFNRFTKLLFAICLVATLAFGQASLSSTTLSAAVAGVPSNTVSLVQLASATGIVAPSFNTPNQPTGNQTMLYVDHEAMLVTAVSGTNVTVIRGYAGTFATGHISGATVRYGPPNYFVNYERFGSCTSTNELVLPSVNFTTGHIFTCATTGGQWAQIGNGTMSASGTQANFGCTGTVGSAETEFLNTAACSGATTATRRIVVEQPGVIGNLRVYSSAVVVGGASKDVATVLKNGSNTTITCTIAAAGTTCSDTSHFVTVAAGDVLTVSFVTATSDTAANVSAVVGIF